MARPQLLPVWAAKLQTNISYSILVINIIVYGIRNIQSIQDPIRQTHLLHYKNEYDYSRHTDTRHMRPVLCNFNSLWQNSHKTFNCLTCVTLWEAWTAKYHLWTDGLPLREQARETCMFKYKGSCGKQQFMCWKLEKGKEHWGSLHLGMQRSPWLIPELRCQVCHICAALTPDLWTTTVAVRHHNQTAGLYINIKHQNRASCAVMESTFPWLFVLLYSSTPLHSRGKYCTF